MTTLIHKQKGVTLSGLLMWAFVLIFGAILGMKMVPAYIHSAQIEQIFKSISADPSMQAVSDAEVKMSYSKKSNINYITDIGPDDIEIDHRNGRLIVSANYIVKIPLVGNITLLLEFKPSSS